jgi:hypothetical protein
MTYSIFRGVPPGWGAIGMSFKRFDLMRKQAVGPEFNRQETM